MQEQKRKEEKKKSNYYFDTTTDQAIVDFQLETDVEKRKAIFVERIQPAFVKLVENIIFAYKFHVLGNIDILKNDCLSFLFESLKKFDSSKGHRAFSYFNVIAKNWCIQRAKINKKKNTRQQSFDDVVLTNLEKSNHQSAVVDYEEELLRGEYIELTKEEIFRWRGKFDKPQEKKVLEAVILLLNNPDLVTIHNKKAIYLYLREISGLNTKQLVTNLSKLKKKYDIFKRKYHAGEM